MSEFLNASFKYSIIFLIGGLIVLTCFCFRYECEESFTTLNVDIRNHQNLLDSLEQYVKGDLLEGANAYHCEKCNKKVIAILYPDITGLDSAVITYNAMPTAFLHRNCGF